MVLIMKNAIKQANEKNIEECQRRLENVPEYHGNLSSFRTELLDTKSEPETKVLELSSRVSLVGDGIDERRRVGIELAVVSEGVGE